MDLKQLFAQRIQKINQLNDFITLYCAKKESIQDLQQLNNDSNEIKGLLSETTDILNQFTTENRRTYKSLMDKMQKQQLILLELLEKQMDKTPVPTQVPAYKFAKPASVDDDSNADESVLKEISNTTMTPNRFRLNEPARMTLTDYLKSPFTNRRVKPIALHFFDFERVISADEFATVPSYMKGRENLEDVQQFLEKVLVQCFTAKYALLLKRREAVPSNEHHFWNLYKSQEEYFKGCKFITQGDICNITEKQIDKKTINRITILRHLKIIREERKNSVICYIWNIPQKR